MSLIWKDCKAPTGGWWHPQAHDHPAVCQTKDGQAVLRPVRAYVVVCVPSCMHMNEWERECEWAPSKFSRSSLCESQRARGKEIILDEGVWRVIFSNISHYSHYILVSQNDTWQNNGFSLYVRKKTPLRLVGLLSITLPQVTTDRKKKVGRKSFFSSSAEGCSHDGPSSPLSVSFPNECDSIL